MDGRKGEIGCTGLLWSVCSLSVLDPGYGCNAAHSPAPKASARSSIFTQRPRSHNPKNRIESE